MKRNEAFIELSAKGTAWAVILLLVSASSALLTACIQLLLPGLPFWAVLLFVFPFVLAIVSRF
jgi:hypothetical protein